MNDGTEIERFEDAYVGSAAKRASWEQIVDKANGLIGEESARELAQYVQGLSLDAPAALSSAALSMSSVS